MDNVKVNGILVDAVCDQCGDTSDVVLVVDKYGDTHNVCFNPQECHIRTEKNSQPLWQFVAGA